MKLIEYTEECVAASQGLWPSSGEGFGGSPVKSARPKAIRVFKNGLIETVFAKAHPITPIFWFGPLIAFGLYQGVTTRGAAVASGLFFVGLFLWSLIEYLLHRTFFHGVMHDLPHQSAQQQFRAFMIHGYHHEFPNDKMRLVAPPLLSWPLGLATWLVYSAVFGAVSPVIFAGTATGYVAYDWVHYYTHHFSPSHRLGKWLKSYHLLHHFDHEQGTKRYGVTSPFWDFAFSSYKPIKRK